MVDVYESIDSVRDAHQPMQHTGSECARNRSPRSVLVCLVVLCVLLLTAVIVLYRDQLTNNIKLTEERDQLLTSNTNLIKQNTKLTQENNRMWEYGWIYYQSSMYVISSERKNWSESRRYCRARGADLIIINNKEEQDFLVRTLHKEVVWIGLSDSEVEGTWKWVDGSKLNIRFWGSGEPKSYRGEDCALYNSTEWTTYPCNTKFYWICENNYCNEPLRHAIR
ncbi:putative CD209 antigen-like protein B [Triplophysa rosa]|uniref:CD209 antigen-like protein B n=1 Tax=Triplophysa rosa TaxID=992332 RepID=A0A9W7T9M5_TRIRA|nr:putative CD209 antigen-like protein B [Triplophysa rosa]